ncbi:hypothetical protein L226DRAFT_573393 [Lentinus tigrinus ALCF2SS1-7]|uniref:Uncharacterized protein n=1 Tax=Lentinus tigrinus ALCF2SS1-6 TaxID=1328759 RepID=A0A5C2S1H8_9APHY|nr:hypothetical protein L227DRAFT_613677 [Lentinus tigrinus ALCF2SS1-6]RPD72024.1 hypothetical protein L226DRAFT_573393 [Lentinus tigrinus ALCF2SS1-7]
MSQLPTIVITPALPSRDSLPTDMRSALDSILSSQTTSTPSPLTTCDTGNRVVWPEELDVTDGLSGDDDDDEGPSTLPNTQSVTAEYRLDLDIECLRFSLGDTLSALYASYCGTSGPDSTTEDSLMVDSDGPASTLSTNPSASCGSGFFVVTEDMAPVSSDEVACDAGTGSVRRVVPKTGECPPTWRHAMYVSSLVWPVQRDREGRTAQRDKPLPPVKSKLRWCGMDSLARTLRIGRQS